MDQLFVIKYLFEVHSENTTNAANYGTRNIVRRLLLSETVDAGHFHTLQCNSNTLKLYNVKNFNFRSSLTGSKEHSTKFTQYQSVI